MNTKSIVTGVIVGLITLTAWELGVKRIVTSV